MKEHTYTHARIHTHTYMIGEIKELESEVKYTQLDNKHNLKSFCLSYEYRRENKSLQITIKGYMT